MTKQDLWLYSQLFNRWQKRQALARKGMPLAVEWSTWPAGFIEFANWSLANGFTPDKVIDRIDGTKGYAPSNCRWVSPQENVWNSSMSKAIKFGGVQYPSQKELWRAKAHATVRYHAFCARLSAGWDIEEALTTQATHGNRWRT